MKWNYSTVCIYGKSVIGVVFHFETTPTERDLLNAIIYIYPLDWQYGAVGQCKDKLQ